MSDSTASQDRERLLEAALRASGPRPQPSAAATERAYAEARAAWQQVLRSDAKPRSGHPMRWVAGLLAASVACVAIVVGYRSTTHVPETAAVVTRVLGYASAAAPAGAPAALHEADSVMIGNTLETPPGGRLALQLPDGRSLRLDQGTRLAITAAHEIRLDRGRIYVDSGPGADRHGLRIATPRGSLVDEGTQFQLAWLDDELQLRVREGSVSISVAGAMPGALTVTAGEFLAVRRDGDVARAPSDNFGPAWAWAADLSAGPGAQEHRLEPILEWICRELGCRLRYAGARTRDLVDAVILDGSVEGMTPGQALEVLERITTFRYRLQSGELTVEHTDDGQ